MSSEGRPTAHMDSLEAVTTKAVTAMRALGWRTRVDRSTTFLPVTTGYAIGLIAVLAQTSVIIG